jgi:hypothetical protein
MSIQQYLPPIISPPKVKYLTNKELLAEIHRSKSTFCWFADRKYKDYDIILPSVKKITRKIQKELLEKRVEKINSIRESDAKARKKPNDWVAITAKELDAEDVVFRVMTSEHIPVDPIREAKAKEEGDQYTRLNFPAFKHYILRDKNAVEVGRSHWKGDLETGYFCQEHGKISDNLARMFLKLVERYGQRGNWRNYTYVEEMKSQAVLQLCQMGLKFDESRSQNPFSYYTASVSNSFTRVLNLEKRNQNIRDDILMMHGQTPSFSRQVDNEIEQRSE